ncbi:hypothetical protein Prum_091220 [Phytohabitans rumicis]|uniref:Uncharacterized protein n=1 Tax=Phytohabitans rumicis TaxID=1076125 RepID=A0A6V8LIU5_9ACTN|nr:hypothetical protein Prum_091220 [Phytohabitans rumicis]
MPPIACVPAESCQVRALRLADAEAGTERRVRDDLDGRRTKPGAVHGAPELTLELVLIDIAQICAQAGY